jgi:hypothetical protein
LQRSRWLAKVVTMSCPPRPPPRRLALGAAALLGAVLLLAACGHPATREDCDAIFTHSAEIELRSQNVTDPKVIAERTAALRAARGEELIQQCLGKRITANALECVRRASTDAEVDRCLD